MVLSDGFFAPVFFFAGFGVGVRRRFVFGVGDFFGFGVDASRVSVSSDRSLRFSSLTCAQRRPAINAPNASAVASQMRKRTTATERNRAWNAINAYSNDLLKKLQNTQGLRLFWVVADYLSRRRSGEWRRRRRRERLGCAAHFLALTPDNGVQFASE